MASCRAFLFQDYDFEPASGLLSLRYAYEDGPSFEEKIFFPPSSRVLSENDRAALDRAFQLVFLLAGVSYYKAYVPQQLICRAFPLDRATAGFIKTVYLNGLGEFAYQNKLTLDFDVVAEAHEAPPPLTLDLLDRPLVPVGGGKDSTVTLEALRGSFKDISLFVLASGGGVAGPIQETVDVSGLSSFIVRRTLSPQLMELNAQGAYNGHVPITAILSAIAVACAIMHGFNAVVMSNERSANAPNLQHNGLDVNHQYSKSFAFEKDFLAQIHRMISPDMRYFSFLRPLSEVDIARRFAKLTAYHGVFRSCNKAFRQDEKARGKVWCCACPKCRFVFLALAPFMNKEALVAVFGTNLLDDATQIDGFMELCGLSAHKPFECVGEVEESRLLMAELARRAEWKGDAVIARLGPLLPCGTESHEESFKKLFIPDMEDSILPDVYAEALHASA